LEKTHVLEVVQGIEHTEDIETILDGLLGEVVDGIITDIILLVTQLISCKKKKAYG
jgi:hypothetical protein